MGRTQSDSVIPHSGLSPSPKDRSSAGRSMGNYFGQRDVLTGGPIVTIRLCATRALPGADNVEGAQRWEDGWTTGLIQWRLRPLRQAALLLHRVPSPGGRSSASRIPRATPAVPARPLATAAGKGAGRTRPPPRR